MKHSNNLAQNDKNSMAAAARRIEIISGNGISASAQCASAAAAAAAKHG